MAGSPPDMALFLCGMVDNEHTSHSPCSGPWIRTPYDLPGEQGVSIWRMDESSKFVRMAAQIMTGPASEKTSNNAQALKIISKPTRGCKSRPLGRTQ